MLELPLYIIRLGVNNIWQYFIQKALQATGFATEEGVVGKYSAFPNFIEVLQHGEVLSDEPALTLKLQGFALLVLFILPQVDQNLCELLFFILRSTAFLFEVLFFYFIQL